MSATIYRVFKRIPGEHLFGVFNFVCLLCEHEMSEVANTQNKNNFLSPLLAMKTVEHKK